MHDMTSAAVEPTPVREELAFRFRHGPAARSLPEFHALLATAPPEAVHFHREHFAPWLRDVLGEAPLARRFEQYAEAGAEPGVLRETLVALVARRLG